MVDRQINSFTLAPTLKIGLLITVKSVVYSLSSTTKKRQLKNQVFAKIIAIAGWLVMITLALLVWHLSAQVLPMLQSPQIRIDKTFSLPSNTQVIQLNDIAQGRALLTLNQACRLEFHTALDSSDNLEKVKTIPGLCSDSIQTHSFKGDVYVARINKSGLLRLEKNTQLQKQIVSSLELSFAITGVSSQSNILDWDFAISETAIMVYVRLENQHTDSIWKVFWVNRQNTSEIYTDIVTQNDLGEPAELEVAPVLLPSINQYLFATETSLISKKIMGNESNILPIQSKVLGFNAVPSHRSIFIHFENNQLQKWSLVNSKGNLKFVPIFSIDDISPTGYMHFHRDENVAILVSSKSDTLTLVNYVTGELLSSFGLEALENQPIIESTWQNNNLYLATNEKIYGIETSGISSVSTLKSLWEKVQYEGYDKPEYVWQTTFASDYQEAKFSVVPLIIGSLKASFLALFIAVPLAILTAIYTGFIAPEKLRNWMKPTIEMLEAVPSVIIGFIAAIWLAPLAEHFLISFILFVLSIPFSLLLFAMAHGRIANALPQQIKQGWELPAVAIVLIVNAFLTIKLGSWLSIESADSDLSIVEFLGLHSFDKSTLVVAIALGIAITPSIYSIAEDAIYDVPSSLKKASYALGATQLQTLRKVVLTLAYPGILSAVTLGLGRAIGETMIVLMVTGNTPVADWDLLTGIRTMTANLAIELPESEVGSSHYQVLFYTALILFLFTFFINTIAEFLRQWLRKNYQSA